MAAEDKEMLSKEAYPHSEAKIIVVDDDQSIIDAVKTALETRKEYEVFSASSGEEALEIFRKHDIDIGFLDIKMPGMNGIELLKKVKEESPQTHIIMMTAYATVDSAVEAMREGAEDYIRKPFEIGDIKSTVLSAIEDIEFEEKSESYTSPPELDWKSPSIAFKNWVEKGREGLIISSERPEILQEEPELDKKINLLLLTEVGDQETQIDPENLEKLGDSIIDFASSREKSVILLDDLDYLLEKNSLDEIKELIDNLENKLSPLDSILIFSGPPENMDEEELRELEYQISDMSASAISNALSNQLRRKIISQLSEEDGISFTTLARKSGIDDSPKMSFHLKKLESGGIIEKDEERRYYLTEMGKNAAGILEEIRSQQTKEAGRTVWMPK